MKKKSGKISRGYRLKIDTHDLILKIQKYLRTDKDTAVAEACKMYYAGLQKEEKEKQSTERKYKRSQAMKKNIIAAVIINLFLLCQLTAQNINGKLGTNGQFIIRDTTVTYLSLSQNNGYLTLNRSLTIPSTTAPNLGVIFKSSNRFLHDYKGTGTSGENLFLGINSGNFTLGGTGSEGSYNVALGSNIMPLLTTGYANCGIGSQALMQNTTGYQNIALGRYTLYNNTTGYNNTAAGYQVLYNSTTAFLNTAMGTQSMFNNITGNMNSAFGYYSLYSNQNGLKNTAVGYISLYGNISGNENTAVGNQSLNTLTGGNNNTGIGSDAQVPNSTGSNQVRIGNTAITDAGIQVAWTITSDRKWKENIQSSDLGLDFISRLKPVSYTRLNDESKKTEYGFIAQDVEESLKDMDPGNTGTGMITIDEKGNYELRYNDLLAPMVKAIQELKAEKDREISALRTENHELKTRLAEFESAQAKIMSDIEKLRTNRSGSEEVKLGDK